MKFDSQRGAIALSLIEDLCAELGVKIILDAWAHRNVIVDAETDLPLTEFTDLSWEA